MNGRIHRDFVASPLPPSLGKIKCGMKSEGGYPMSLDYFVASGKYAPLFHEAYGEKPSTLLVYFPSNDPELVCKEEYVYRDKAGKKIATGDGETFDVWSERENMRIRLTTDKHPDLMEQIEKRYPSPTGWQVTLTLKFVCPLVNRIYGVWTFETKGKMSSIPQIRDTFDAMLEKNGKIEGVLCDLNVQYARSDSPKANRFPVVSLIPNESAENVNRIKALTQNIIDKV